MNDHTVWHEDNEHVRRYVLDFIVECECGWRGAEGFRPMHHCPLAPHVQAAGYICRGCRKPIGAYNAPCGCWSPMAMSALADAHVRGLR